MNGKDGFAIVLRNKKQKSYILLSRIFIALNLTTIAFYFIFNREWYWFVIFTAISSGYFFGRKYWRKRPVSPGKMSGEAFAGISLAWFFLNWAMGIFLILTWIIFRLSLQKMKFVFTREGITRSFFPKKQYTWNEIDSTVINAGILTVNFRNDHLLQGEIEYPDEVDVSGFNSFVRDCIGER